MAKYRLPRRNWPAKTRPIKIADGIYTIAGLAFMVALFCYDDAGRTAVSLSLGQTGLILLVSFVVAEISEVVSNRFRRRIGLPSLDDEIMLYEAA